MSKINREKQAAMPQKVLHELFEYNSETGSWVWLVSPNRKIKVGQIAGYVDKLTGYVQIRINRRNYRAHRLAWTYTYGDYPNGEQPLIDHINGRRDDNRIENLRVSSHGENQKNRKMNSDNTSGITGVFRYKIKRPSDKVAELWIAQWYDENGKQRNKTFNIEKLGEEPAEQAAIAYRSEQLHLLELNHGIAYSARHGV